MATKKELEDAQADTAEELAALAAVFAEVAAACDELVVKADAGNLGSVRTLAGQIKANVVHTADELATLAKGAAE